MDLPRPLVLAHGTFDLLHPGHVAHLEAAKRLGASLLVSITAAPYVRKGPNRPVYSDAERTLMLRALACVDAVHVSEEATAVEAIQRFRPDVFVKGRDWLAGGIIDAEREAVEAVGGKVVYVGDHTHSSSALINRAVRPHDAALRDFLASTGLTPTTFRDAVHDLAAVRCLVLGDEIIDEYHTVEPLGLTAKTPVLSLRRVSKERQDGGVLAVRRHLAAFADQVCYLPSGRPPIIKERYISPPANGQPLTKHFGVNHFPLPTIWNEAGYLEGIEAAMAEADVVVVADFGHGTMTDAVRALVQEAPCLAVNCQTNSANHGFNLIHRQYGSCDAFTVDRTELALALGHPTTDAEADLRQLASDLTAQYAVLTRGGQDTVGIHVADKVASCPVLEHQPVDTLGAGDAFFALMALGVAKGYPLPVVILLGQLAGAQAVMTVGNRVGVQRDALIQHGMALLAGVNE